MKEQFVQMSFYKLEPGDLLPTNAWEMYFATGIKGWVQQLLWKILLRTGAARVHFDQKQLVKSIAIDKDKLAKQIILECADMLRYNGKDPIKVLIGPDKFMELMGPMGLEPWEFQPFSLDTEVQISYRRKYTAMGLQVEVVPHMKGILVL